MTPQDRLRPLTPPVGDGDESSGSTPFSMHVSSHKGIGHIAVSGEIDLSTADALARALNVACNEQRHVVVDLAGVTFIDSSGLQVLALARKDYGNVHFERASRVVRRTMECSGLAFLCDDPRNAG